MTPDLEKEGPVVSTSSRSLQRQAQRTSEEAKRSQDSSGKGERKSQLAQTLPKRVQNSQIGAFSHGNCIQYGQNSYGMHSEGAGKDEQDFSTKIIAKVRYKKYIINVKFNQIQTELKKFTSHINDSKKNGRNFTSWCKVTHARLESISNTCYIFESEFQVQNDELEDPSINHISDQHTIL
ncbi:hypothetical protein O181_023563 [Austropuccinia psidii MF-1]|uniref:Uncharacterized protein n=1 Tax=Austropuccinia psidii MF-1 TaxID=1389203 RepID=A0A9Q3GXE2_9BASI|nr:hypothetical protein [Austropuccinia psidii MF-1]